MDNVRLREQIAELAEENRQARIERGLPPEEPEDFVDETLSFALCFKELKPFHRIAVKYARIVSDGGYFKIDTSKFDRYVKYAELLRYSKMFSVNSDAAGVRGMISFMDEINEHLDGGSEERVLSKDILTLSLYIQFMDMPGDIYFDYTQPDMKHMSRIREEVSELLDDPERLQSELDVAFTHYDSIKHLN